MSQAVIYYLEMTSPQHLHEKRKPRNIEILEAEIKQFKCNKFLYQLVGGDWNWIDKLSLSDEDWKRYAENENLRTWVAYFKGSIAGYYELEKQSNYNVEIAYFGLAPGFIGKGFGGYLLSHAVKSAWEWSGTKRVWVHTCTLDHESALSNYRARGFQVYYTSHSQ